MLTLILFVRNQAPRLRGFPTSQRSGKAWFNYSARVRGCPGVSVGHHFSPYRKTEAELQCARTITPGDPDGGYN